MTIFGIIMGSFGGLTSKFLDWSYGFEAKDSKYWLILGMNYRDIWIKSNIVWHRPHLKSMYLRPYMLLDPKNRYGTPKSCKKKGFWGISPKSPIQKSCETSQNFCMGFWETPALADCLNNFIFLNVASREVCTLNHIDNKFSGGGWLALEL